MAQDRMFVEALEAIRLGQTSRARDLLTRLLQNDKDNEHYWLYMSSVVDSNKEQIFCLENVLRINPKNASAKRGMVLIGAKPAEGKIKPIRPKLQREWEIGDVHGLGGKNLRDRIKIPTNRLIGFGVLSVLLIGLIYVGVTGFGSGGSGRSQVTGGGAGITTATATSEFTPVPTPPGGGPMFPDLDGPTPLVSFLEVAYTPTPLYIESNHISGAFDAGLSSLGHGDYEQAIEFFDQFLDAEPGTVDALYYLGEAYLGFNETLRAEENFSSAIEFDETFGPAYVGRAKANIIQLQLATVTDDLGRAVAHNPDFVEAYLVYAEYFYSRDTEESFEFAIENAEIALELSPDHARAYHILAKVYLDQGLFEEALEAAQKAFEFDITIVENYIVMGEALIENDLIAEAKASIEIYTNYFEPDEYIWILLGRAQQAIGEHEEALTSFETAVDLAPNSLDLKFLKHNYYRGISYLALEDYENAIARLKTTTSIFPNWFEAHLYHGVAILLNGDGATGYSTISAHISKAKTDEQLALFYYWRALAAEAIDRFDLAEDDWNALIALPDEAMQENNWKTIARSHLAGPTSTPIPTLTPFPSPTP